MSRLSSFDWTKEFTARRVKYQGFKFPIHYNKIGTNVRFCLTWSNEILQKYNWKQTFRPSFIRESIPDPVPCLTIYRYILLTVGNLPTQGKCLTARWLTLLALSPELNLLISCKYILLIIFSLSTTFILIYFNDIVSVCILRKIIKDLLFIDQTNVIFPSPFETTKLLPCTEISCHSLFDFIRKNSSPSMFASLVRCWILIPILAVDN